MDPIDGTNNFARGIPFFCVSIAAAIDGRLEAATVFDPIRDELIVAGPRGAFINGKSISAAGATDDAAATLLTDYPDPVPETNDFDVRRFGRLVTTFGTVRRLGSSALALAYVACGRADVALVTNAHEWDIAAGSLLVSVAGGQHAIPKGQDGSLWAGPTYVAACREFDLSSSAVSSFLRFQTRPTT